MDLISTADREVEYILTPEDLAGLSRELVNLLGQIEEEVADQAAEKASMKERLAAMQARQSKLAGMIRRGRERRLVRVDVLANWEQDCAMLRRQDTGDIIEQRPLYDSEKQMPLGVDTRAAAHAAAVEHSEP